MIARAKTLAAAAGAVSLLLVATWAITYLRTDAAAYDRGVRDQKIITINATEMLNAALRALNAKAVNAALDYEAQRRAALDLERELADERANDADALGACISDAGWLRIDRAR